MMKKLQNSTANLQKSIKYQPSRTIVPQWCVEFGTWRFPEVWLLELEALTSHALFRPVS
jgi:hypothetical protein